MWNPDMEEPACQIPVNLLPADRFAITSMTGHHENNRPVMERRTVASLEPQQFHSTGKTQLEDGGN
jgi:hypothetical protein